MWVFSQSLKKQIPSIPADNLPDGDEPVQSFALVQRGVRYVQIGVDSTYEGGSGRDWQGGIGEIRFEGTLVPEPSAALLGGFGALLLLRRRRHA